MSGLDIGEQMKILLLKRVHDGAITYFMGFYFDAGQRIWWPPAAAALGSLLEIERLQLTYPERRNPAQVVGLTVAERTARVGLTARGLAEYEELCERRKAADHEQRAADS